MKHIEGGIPHRPYGGHSTIAVHFQEIALPAICLYLSTLSNTPVANYVLTMMLLSIAYTSI